MNNKGKEKIPKVTKINLPPLELTNCVSLTLYSMSTLRI